MYKALFLIIGYSIATRTSIILIHDSITYMKYKLPPLPLTSRRFFYSKTLPFCFLAGYLRYKLNEPFGDYLKLKHCTI